MSKAQALGELFKPKNDRVRVNSIETRENLMVN
jgi:hypothetical protein